MSAALTARFFTCTTCSTRSSAAVFELTSWTYCRDNSAFELGKGAFVAPWILHNASTYKWGTLGHIEVLHSGRCTTRSTSVLLRSTRSVPETYHSLFVATARVSSGGAHSETVEPAGRAAQTGLGWAASPIRTPLPLRGAPTTAKGAWP